MRFGAATTLVQGELPMPTLSRQLRHRDQWPGSSKAYVPESVHVAETTAAMRAAVHRCSSCSGRGADGVHRGPAPGPRTAVTSASSPAETLVVIQS